MGDPLMRPLKAYAFDPSLGKLLGNELAMRVRYQKLWPGPIVDDNLCRDAIAVVDYDGANGTYYRPVDLDNKDVLIRGGLDPDEADPQFHQQMVYAVVTETIQHFEAALGRRIHWRRSLRDRKGKPTSPLEDIHTLNLYPHAFIGENAFYSPSAHGILFGYYRAAADSTGRNLPGQTVFTCLSHDIIAHETTHAIVDGIRPFFTEQTNEDVAAFHEALADLVAMFRHFTHQEALFDTMERTGGMLYQARLRPDAAVTAYDDDPDAAPSEKKGPKLSAQISQRNPLIELARQFGESTGRTRALRSALGTRPNSDDIKKIMEPHRRGSILVAAVFDAYFAIYFKRTADLWRIYRAGGGNPNPVDIPRALADRLCKEAAGLASQFFTICTRALDYTPPVDITFGSYLRSMVTADLDVHPNDSDGLRDAILEAFRLRGILPEDAHSFGEDAVAWPRPQAGEYPAVVGLDFGDPNGLVNVAPRRQQDKVGDLLRAYVNANAVPLGFAPPDRREILVPSFHPVFRVNLDGSLRTDMVVQAIQTMDSPFDRTTKEYGSFPIRGGVSLVVRKPVFGEEGAKTNEAEVRYVIRRHIDEKRISRQRRFGERLGLAGDGNPNPFRMDFALVHGGF